MTDLTPEEREKIRLLELETNLEDLSSSECLKDFYQVVLDSFSFIGESLKGMFKSEDRDYAMHLVIDKDITWKLTFISEWLTIAERSAANGPLALWSQSEDFINLNQELSKAVSKVLQLTQCEQLDNIKVLRDNLYALEDRVDIFNMKSIHTPTGDIIRIDEHGVLKEKPSRLKDVLFRAWRSEERMERLPTTDKMRFQTFESDVYTFETMDEKNKQPFEVTKIPKVDLVFQVKVDNRLDPTDISLFAKVSSKENKWTTIKCQLKDGYAVFRADRVASFCVVRAPKETDIMLSPKGGQYIHKADRRVQIEFPEEAVKENDALKIQVLPVHKEEMAIRRKLFPRQYTFLAMTKGVHVEGSLQKAVDVQIPMEKFETEDSTDDVEYLYIHIDKDEEVEIIRDKPIQIEGNLIKTSVESFSLIAAAQVRRGSRESVSKMESRIALGLLYHCQILTFVKKTQETYIQVWCEVVKKEDAQRIEAERLEEFQDLAKVPGPQKDIFIKEEERVRVDFSGNANINKRDVPLSHLLITFIPIAEQNSIFVPLLKRIGATGSPFTTVSFTADKYSKNALSMVSFDPWSLRKTQRTRQQSSLSNPPSRNVSRQNSIASVERSLSDSSSDFVGTVTRQTSAASASAVDEKEEFDNFFANNKLENLKQTFVEQEFDCMEALLHVTEEDMKGLDIGMGPRKKFLSALEKFRKSRRH